MMPSRLEEIVIHGIYIVGTATYPDTYTVILFIIDLVVISQPFINFDVTLLSKHHVERLMVKMIAQKAVCGILRAAALVVCKRIVRIVTGWRLHRLLLERMVVLLLHHTQLRGWLLLLLLLYL